MNWNFRFITDWDYLFTESFQGQWLQWVESAENSHVFFHPVLCMAWIETYLPLRNLDLLFCIAEGEESTIVLPLVVWNQNWKNAWRRLIVPVGFSDFDYHDPLLVGAKISTDSLDQFYSELLRQLSGMVAFDELILDGLTAESTLKEHSAENDVAPFLVLSEVSNGDQLLKMLPSHLRGDIKRRIRRYDEKGFLSIVHFNHDSEFTQLSQFLKAHSSRWPGAFKAPNFHVNLLKYGSSSGLVHFSGLFVDESVISWHLGFVYNNRYNYYMSAIESSWADFSPGKLHIFKLMEYAVQQKFEVFDFLRGGETYKTGWTNQQRQIYQLRCSSGRKISRVKKLAVEFKNFLR